MNILDAPNELLLLIGENLSIKDLFHLILTCNQLQYLLTPLLEKLGVQDVGEQTSLQWAAERGHASLARLAISKGVQIDEPSHEDSDARNPLHLAAKYNHPDVIRILATNGATIDARDEHSRTPLHFAAQCCSPEAIRILIAHGAAVDARDEYSCTPLLLATESNTPDVVRILVAHGASINARDGHSRTPLHFAAQRNTADFARILVAHGAKVNCRDECSRTPLHLAAECDSPEIIRILAVHGAKMDARDEYSQTPLHLAAECDHADNIHVLVGHRATIDAGDDFSCTPLHLAASWSRAEATRVLIKLGANMMSTDRQMNMPGHDAAIGASVACMAAFIEAGFAFDTRGCGGLTILHNAAAGKIAILEYLLRQNGVGTAINLPDSNGFTPLHWAVSPRHGALLLLHGADPELKDNSGNTPTILQYITNTSEPIDPGHESDDEDIWFSDIVE